MMEKTTFDLIVVGVGGQGTLLASKILGQLAIEAGWGVKLSEVHGMSQRGGSVVTHVRLGNEIHAPLVSEGEADFLLGFEALEAARAAVFVKPGGTAIMNTQRILPMPVITGTAVYPEDPQQWLSGCKIKAVDALAMAIEAGNAKAVNLVLLGILSQYLPFPKETWIEAIKTCVPPKILQVNLDAFEKGCMSA